MSFLQLTLPNVFFSNSLKPTPEHLLNCYALLFSISSFPLISSLWHVGIHRIVHFKNTFSKLVIPQASALFSSFLSNFSKDYSVLEHSPLAFTFQSTTTVFVSTTLLKLLVVIGLLFGFKPKTPWLLNPVAP